MYTRNETGFREWTLNREKVGLSAYGSILTGWLNQSGKYLLEALLSESVPSSNKLFQRVYLCIISHLSSYFGHGSNLDNSGRRPSPSSHDFSFQTRFDGTSRVRRAAIWFSSSRATAEPRPFPGGNSAGVTRTYTNIWDTDCVSSRTPPVISQGTHGVYADVLETFHLTRSLISDTGFEGLQSSLVNFLI